MKKENLSDKSIAELTKMLEKKREEVRKTSLSILQKKEKNVKKAGVLKKEVARILTAINATREEKNEKDN